jgi:YhcN/YlaJ family sporulation lipoprotein
MGNNNDESGMRNNDSFPAPTRVQNQAPPANNRNQANDIATTYRVADNIADKLVKISGVKSCTVLIDDQTAYVGATVDPSIIKTKSQDRKLKQTLLEQTKMSDPNVRSVYVSTSPSFATELQRIGDDIRTGKLENIDDRIQKLISQSFPSS